LLLLMLSLLLLLLAFSLFADRFLKNIYRVKIMTAAPSNARAATKPPKIGTGTGKR